MKIHEILVHNNQNGFLTLWWQTVTLNSQSAFSHTILTWQRTNCSSARHLPNFTKFIKLNPAYLFVLSIICNHFIQCLSARFQDPLTTATTLSWRHFHHIFYHPHLTQIWVVTKMVHVKAIVVIWQVIYFLNCHTSPNIRCELWCCLSIITSEKQNKATKNATLSDK